MSNSGWFTGGAMPSDASAKQDGKSRSRSVPRWRRWLRRGFLIWAATSTALLADSYRTRGVAPELLHDDARVIVRNTEQWIEFRPVSAKQGGLVFLCGGGVAAAAYAPLLRPLAEAGHPVFVVKLPYRFAPFESHKEQAVERARRILADRGGQTPWVLAGHSLGAALACRLMRDSPQFASGLALLGTTHPKADSLAWLKTPVVKVYGTRDGVAPSDDVLANARLLPDHTRWVRIDGGNHSQFAHYGRQLLDGSPTISREAQQAQVRRALLECLAAAGD